MCEAEIETERGRGRPPGSVRRYITRYAERQDIPAGVSVVRLLGTEQRLTGTGTNSETVYVVLVEEADA